MLSKAKLARLLKGSQRAVYRLQSLLLYKGPIPATKEERTNDSHCSICELCCLLLAFPIIDLMLGETLLPTSSSSPHDREPEVLHASSSLWLASPYRRFPW